MTDQQPSEPSTTDKADPTALDAIAAAGLTPDDIAAASNTASAPINPQDAEINALRDRMQRAENEIAALKTASGEHGEKHAALLDRIARVFGSKV